MINSVLLLPSHGHAPYLLGVNLLRNLEVDICVPHYYGERQREILKDEFSKKTNIDRIFLSRDLGLLFKSLLSDKDNAPTFNEYSKNVRSEYEAIGNELGRILTKGVDAISLSGKDKRFLNFDFAVNTGLPVCSPVKPTIYAFVGKMSEIYRRAPKETNHTESLAKVWDEVESSFTHWFVPRLNSLWYLKYQEKVINETPSLESPTHVNHDDLVQPNSILVVSSGTDKGVPELKELIASAPKKYTFITLDESNDVFKELNLRGYSPRVWGNPNVIAVLARSGFGTIWKALVNEKPIGVIKAPIEDDPEIYHNAQVVRMSGIGTMLDNNLDPLIDALPQYLSKIQEQLEIDKKTFKKIDGIKYTSDELRKIIS